jgi:hypothetical protein
MGMAAAANIRKFSNGDFVSGSLSMDERKERLDGHEQ